MMGILSGKVSNVSSWQWSENGRLLLLRWPQYFFAILIRNIGTWCIGSRTTISVASSIKLVSIVPLVGTRISYIQYANRGTCLKGRTEASASVDARWGFKPRIDYNSTHRRSLPLPPCPFRCRIPATKTNESPFNLVKWNVPQVEMQVLMVHVAAAAGRS